MLETHFTTPPKTSHQADSVQNDSRQTRGENSEFVADVVAGLSQSPKRLDSKYLYDERGSALFDRICTLKEYYPTRTELAIMRGGAAEMAQAIGPSAVIVELGSGSSRKTRLLLDHLQQPRAYLPMDISQSHIQATAQRLREEYPGLPIEPLVGDFNETIEIPHRFIGSPICVYFPGSTIGNLTSREAIRLLGMIHDRCGEDGGLLIGFDLQKDVATLETAYNDCQGVTAAFSLNLLQRINREASADFRIADFRHVAIYNPQAARIEISLESLRDQVVRVDDIPISFSQGERILTEYSHKYTLASFTSMAAQAGLLPKKTWLDDQHHFAVMYLEPHHAI